jgi:ADP-ribose pyrophosphatase
MKRLPMAPDADDSHLMEVAVRQQQVWRGHFLDVRLDHVALPGGGEATREYIVHPGAVMVVPVLDDGRLVMERQCRYPLGGILLEFPAGKIDPGESRLACAQRELAEETGYRAAEWALATVMHNAPAYSNEVIEVWFARGLSLGEQRLDEGEFIEVCLTEPDELDRLAAAGQLTDAKTLIGLLWLQKWRRGEWALDWQPAPAAVLAPSSQP